MTKRQFVYVEDVEGWHHNHVLMAREGTSRLNTKYLWKLSREGWCFGFISADDLVVTARRHGLKLRIVERRDKSEGVPPEWSDLPIVRGPSGCR
ncbi:hypothetical protein A3C96_02165 [Candidatus Uhrbacteria bacterium RIFCSPHIGHO2_02_FULL_60_10]|uniref:Uncharacterized protein n=1 Tax=Candidatus Uhrbacteria bacterium RIFCSPHIGHO2_02_FULL_60_10 TaxID=1802392 RepID=A0A1F7U744_9BACT|nr:MAG: hypothetical protein A3C96_02165 [Candidatus Uhrbacteria bacterium RIFCSPHIGHO2_02_FULL_60_10]